MIRIIAGSAKGKRLKTLNGFSVRITSDKVRGAIFNILGDAILGASVLDLFSGSGALGIEALSRGAKECVFIDNDIRCVNIIRDNLVKCGFTGKVIRGDVYEVIKRLNKEGFDIVLADPPYGLDLARNLLLELNKYGILKKFSFVILEHSKRDRIEEPLGWQRIQRKRYGDTVISVYKYEKHHSNISRHI